MPLQTGAMQWAHALHEAGGLRAAQAVRNLRRVVSQGFKGEHEFQ
jgi:hypothetical protein